ncbi:hypothetical protein M2T82_00580 [Elizabethkingia ursingii]|uniref:hypothetical protein n=1 Tax=Elizabethkingia ursingii TaxID=1756150 RepID=UPI002012AF37|nr:hypothetical protein [Elizabethkingia ursingii]MCL1666548.1 hypothetical protein [Elizabethkingia ursingii]
MTKATIISISVIIFTLSTMQSCRDNEIDPEPENKVLSEKIRTENVNKKTDSDSLQTAPTYLVGENGNETADPPPKDRDQWKH